MDDENTRINKILIGPGIVFEQVYEKVPDRFSSTGYRWKQPQSNVELFESLYDVERNTQWLTSKPTQS
jgi:hypothetical protein